MVLEGVSQLLVSNTVSESISNFVSNSVSDTIFDTESKKPVDPIIGHPSNLYNLSFMKPSTIVVS
jgi:hypothetical protein